MEEEVQRWENAAEFNKFSKLNEYNVKRKCIRNWIKNEIAFLAENIRVRIVCN